MANLIYTKNVVLQGCGVRRPNDLSSVTINICGRYITENDAECVFEREANAVRKLGESVHEGQSAS